MNEKPMRKKNRLKGFDYSSKGDYFVTFCVKNRENIFWKHDYKNIQTKDSRVLLNQNGFTVEKVINDVNKNYADKMVIEKFTIMPDHIHLLVYICQDNCISLEQTIRMIKRQITIETGIKNIWQKGFFDHIIRNDKDYDETWDYIDANARRLTENMFLK